MTRPRRTMSWAWAAPVLGLFRRNIGRTATIAACVAMMGGIAGNAILLQKGHHPAPLFGSNAPRPADAAPAPSAAPPLPPPKPSPALASAEPAVPEPLPTQSIAPEVKRPPAVIRADHPRPKAAVAVHPPAERKPDGIARLLGATPKPADPARDASVLAAQKALSKLGYDIKPDGRMSAATRQALAKFGQDRHMKIGSDISPAVLRELEHAAGARKG